MTVPMPRSSSFTLISPMPPDACVARLREAAVSFRGWAWVYAWFSRKPLMGEVSPTAIRVRIHTTPRSPFIPHPPQLGLTATLERMGDGTRLVCNLTRSFTRRLVALLLLVTVLLIAIYRAAIWFVEIGQGESIWKTWWAGPLLLFGCFLLWSYTRSSRREAAFLEHVLADWLGTRREDLNALQPQA